MRDLTQSSEEESQVGGIRSNCFSDRDCSCRKARRSALEAVANILSPTAAVIRDGQRDTIVAEDLVPGDVVLLDSGDKVPADLRLVEATPLQIDEAMLTGESVPAGAAARARTGRTRPDHVAGQAQVRTEPRYGGPVARRCPDKPSVAPALAATARYICSRYQSTHSRV